MPLTDLAVRQTKPREKQFKLSDEKGLHLLIKPNGGKYWRLKYRFGGKEKSLALGVYPEVSLSDARVKRDDAREQLSEGIDPGEQRRLNKLVRQTLASNSFETVARDWHHNQEKKWSDDHAKRVLSSLETDAFPSLGARSITEITAPEVLATIRAVEKRGALDVASRVLQRINAVFKYAVQSGLAQTNPASELTGVLETRKVTHRLALERDELGCNP